MESKQIWASKTFWANVIGAGAMAASAAGFNVLNIEQQQELIGGVMVLVNIALRFVTSKPISAG